MCSFAEIHYHSIYSAYTLNICRVDHVWTIITETGTEGDLLLKRPVVFKLKKLATLLLNTLNMPTIGVNFAS